MQKMREENKVRGGTKWGGEGGCEYKVISNPQRSQIKSPCYMTAREKSSRIMLLKRPDGCLCYDNVCVGEP